MEVSRSVHGEKDALVLSKHANKAAEFFTSTQEDLSRYSKLKEGGADLSDSFELGPGNVGSGPNFNLIGGENEPGFIRGDEMDLEGKAQKCKSNTLGHSQSQVKMVNLSCEIEEHAAEVEENQGIESLDMERDRVIGGNR